MRKALLVAVAALGLTAAACSKATQDKTSADAKAAVAKTGDVIKDVVASPEMKRVGGELKTAVRQTAAATEAAGQHLAADVKTETSEAKAKIRAKPDEARN